MAEYIERTEELILAVNAGARVIENTKKYHGATYCMDVFSDNPKEILYLKAAEVLREFDGIPAADVAPVVRCRECKHRNKQKCPLVMVRFDMKPNGKMKKVLEQNYVDDEFWCKDGARMDGADQ